MPVYTRNHPLHKYLRAVDPKTGEHIDFVAWADTDWAMLKIIRHETVDGVKRIQHSNWMQVYDNNGQPLGTQREVLVDYVVRDFDLVDKESGQILHRVRVDEVG